MDLHYVYKNDVIHRIRHLKKKTLMVSQLRLKCRTTKIRHLENTTLCSTTKRVLIKREKCALACNTIIKTFETIISDGAS